MGELLMRRREMILPSAAPTPVIPSGYVTDGLIFFLDGKQLASASSWTDIVGGKTFELTNCSLGTNGVVFDGTAYGIYNGRISNDWSNETIEAVFDGYSGIKTKFILGQPFVDNSVGISLRFGDGGGNNVRVVPAIDGTRRTYYQANNVLNTTGKKRVGCSANTPIVVNGSKLSGGSITNYSANNTGTTTLGGGRFSDDVTSTTMYIGTIYCVRIYNRKLTEAELKANQDNDLLYYA